MGPASDAARQLTGEPWTSGPPWMASIGRVLLSRRTHVMPGGLVLYLHPTLADIDLSLLRPNSAAVADGSWSPVAERPCWSCDTLPPHGGPHINQSWPPWQTACHANASSNDPSTRHRRPPDIWWLRTNPPNAWLTPISSTETQVEQT